jgi:nucleoside-diphosphate-sugar epimerase
MNQNSEKPVIFGTGPLGLAVMDALIERGYQDITLVNRSGQVNEPLPDGVTVVAGDATNPDQVAQICQTATVVFHCAQPGYTEWPEKFTPITQGILEGVSRTQARLVFGDNLYMYGPTDGRLIHPELPYAATGPKGKTRAHMAQLLLEAHRAGKVRVTIGRASDFYGPRVIGSAVGDMVFEAALTGKTVNALGNVDQPHTYTYIRDFGRALVTLSEHEAAFGQAWHVPNAETITTRQFVELVGREVGRPLKIRTAGRWMVTLLGLFSPQLREFKEMMYEFTEPYVVDHSQFAAAFGPVSVTSHQVAIKETLAWYRQHLAQA